MAHGSSIKAGYTGPYSPIVGDAVAFYQMSRPVNGSGPGPGPHRAIVLRVGSYSQVDLQVGETTEENVSHRSAADGPRLWDWK